MTTHMFMTDVSQSGVLATLANDQDGVYVARDVAAGSTNNDGVIGFGFGLKATIQGTLAAEYAAIYFGNNAAVDYGHRITIEAEAQVFSFASAAIRTFGYDTVVNNAGRIFGEYYGVELYGIEDTATPGTTRSTLNNSGIIESNGEAVTRYGGGATEALVINNTGTIKGGTYAFQSYNADAIEQIYNKGTMSGTIALGQGNDVYDGRGGHHSDGRIYGGSGNDKIWGGTDADHINGGAGRDQLFGGAGRDIFYFRAGESGASSSTRDFILDFRHNVDKIHLADIDPIPGGGNEAFIFDAARGTASSAVATGHVGWFWDDNAGTANDRTIIKMNLDGDAAFESTIQLDGLINLTASDFIL